MQFLGVQVPAQKNGLDGLAELGQSLVGRVLDVVPGETPQDSFRLRRPQAQRCGVFDHLVVLLAHQIPIVIFQSRRQRIVKIDVSRKSRAWSKFHNCWLLASILLSRS